MASGHDGVGRERGDRKRNVGTSVGLGTDKNCWRSLGLDALHGVLLPQNTIYLLAGRMTLSIAGIISCQSRFGTTPQSLYSVYAPRARCVQPVCPRTITILSFTQLYIIINTCVGNTTPTDGRHGDARDNHYCT